jgi:ABC-2 type transport system permease protein
MLDGQTITIVWAQWRGLLNRYARGGPGAGGAAFVWAMMAVWYGLVALLAWVAAGAAAGARNLETLEQAVGIGLFLAFLYWQLMPVLMVSAGLSLDMKRLLAYPIPEARLFGIEVVLRVTTGAEVLILLCGLAAGLARNPEAPWWGPLSLLPFALFNFFLSAGVRDLLTRLFSRRGVRELTILGIVVLTALPNLLIAVVPSEQWRRISARYVEGVAGLPLPWQWAARLSVGEPDLVAAAGLAAYCALAWWFGLRQFRRSLRWDAAAARSEDRSRSWPWFAGLAEAFFRLPSRLLPDPLGGLVEKEFRFLCRAPRFRLLFTMGFTFGLVIFLPLLIGRGSTPGAVQENFLVLVSLYSALLLGEALFWNVFGYDRHAAQAYYVLPLNPRSVLLAKNSAALALLLLQVSCVTLAVSLLRLNVTPMKVAECYAVTLLLSLFMLAAGNLASTHYPRPVNPAQSWRNMSSGRLQAILLLLYPAIAAPIALAYLARWAFESDWAFFGVLLSGFVVAALGYWVSLDSSVAALDERREAILESLSRAEGPAG